MKTEEKDTSITFRTTKKLRKSIEAQAVKESRTLSNMIEVLIEKALETIKKEK